MLWKLMLTYSFIYKSERKEHESLLTACTACFFEGLVQKGGNVLPSMENSCAAFLTTSKACRRMLIRGGKKTTQTAACIKHKPCKNNEMNSNVRNKAWRPGVRRTAVLNLTSLQQLHVPKCYLHGTPQQSDSRRTLNFDPLRVHFMLWNVWWTSSGLLMPMSFKESVHHQALFLVWQRKTKKTKHFCSSCWWETANPSTLRIWLCPKI